MLTRAPALACGLVALAGCVRASPATSYTRLDAEVLNADGPVSIEIVGQAYGHSAHSQSDLFVFAGEYLRGHGADDWLELDHRWGGLLARTLAPMSRMARRGNHRSSELHDQGDDTWWYADVVSGGARWRLVMLDVDQRALGRRWADQLTWLPKVVSGDGYDRLIALMQPGTSESTAALLDIVDEYAQAVRLQVVIQGASQAELRLPEGEYGPIFLDVGPVRDGALPFGSGPLGVALSEGYPPPHGSSWILVLSGKDVTLIPERGSPKLRFDAAAGWVVEP